MHHSTRSKTQKFKIQRGTDKGNAQVLVSSSSIPLVQSTILIGASAIRVTRGIRKTSLFPLGLHIKSLFGRALAHTLRSSIFPRKMATFLNHLRIGKQRRLLFVTQEWHARTRAACMLEPLCRTLAGTGVQGWTRTACSRACCVLISRLRRLLPGMQGFRLTGLLTGLLPLVAFCILKQSYATFWGSNEVALQFFSLAPHSDRHPISVLRFIVSFRDNRHERQFILQLTFSRFPVVSW